MRYKYPRTYHLPWSAGCTSDDKRMPDTDHLDGHSVVVTEKMDGENTTLYPDGYVHARSIDSSYHPSRTWVTGWWAQIAYKVPSTLRICGENLYAKHSIAYDDLASYFLAFGVWEGDVCLSWADTVKVLTEHGIPTVPVLYEGPYDENKIYLLRGREGYVVRRSDAFSASNFPQYVGKYVRLNHVQTSEHWTNRPVVPNKLR